MWITPSFWESVLPAELRNPLKVTASTAHEILMLALGSLRGSRNAAAGQSGEEGTLLFGQDTLKGILSLFAASSPLFCESILVYTVFV